MKETEVKILNVNRHQVIETLSCLGAEKIFDDKIETFFFDFENGSIAKAKNIMRLRREGKKSVLTYKRVVRNEAAKVARGVRSRSFKHREYEEDLGVAWLVRD